MSKRAQDRTKNLGEVIDRLAQPVAFYREGSKVPELWGCGNCGHVFGNERDARHCYYCAPRVCEDEACNERTRDRFYRFCVYHAEERERARELERFRAAKKVLLKDAPCEYFVTPAGKFIYDLEELSYDGMADYPRYVYATAPMRFQLSFEAMMENAIERIDIDDPGCIFPTNGERELKKAFDEFNATQPDASWHEEDSGTVIVLPWPDPAECGHAPDEVSKDWPERWDPQAVLEGREPPL